jgi:AcrR family transcriptional regulator
VASIGAPQNARSRRTVAALLQAARELIDEGGVEALTMAAVAERAGVSRRAVYLHFPSRASLINGLVEDLKGAGGLDVVLRPVWEAPDALTMLDEWARCMVSILPRIMPIVRAIQRVSRTDPDAAQHWEEATRARHAACRRIAERLHDEGRLAPPWTVDTAADMMLALTSFEVIETLLDQCRWPVDRLARHLAAVFCGTFVAPAPVADQPDHDAGRSGSPSA